MSQVKKQKDIRLPSGVYVEKTVKANQNAFILKCPFDHSTVVITLEDVYRLQGIAIPEYVPSGPSGCPPVQSF
jgi:hypothetical protein